ncbi:hypothetical protein [Flavobacterium sp.]|uniref:hypothetical protein n=1 Tax=Flavobacterium sp. TaxID=239 RepID=UPI003D28B38F
MKKILSLLIISSAFLACTDDDIKVEQDFSNGPKVLGFSSNFESVAYFEDLGAVERNFPVNILGNGNGQLSDTDITVTYEVDAASTATEGVEFDFADTSGMVTIPAGSTFGMFPLMVNTGDLNPTEKTELILNLTTSSEGTVVGAQYNRLRIVFVGCQTQIATAGSPGSFTCTIVRNDGATVVRPTETVSLVDINTLKTTTTGTWAPGTIAPDQAYNFIDICGDITVPVQGLCQGYYSNQVYGLTADGTDGEVDDINNFNATYEITFGAGNRQYTNTYVRN